MDKGTEAERFKVCCSNAKQKRKNQRKCVTWRDVDWLFHGTWVFVVVGVSEVLNADPFNYSMQQNLINSCVWLIDSVLFLIDWFAWQEDCCPSGQRAGSGDHDGSGDDDDDDDDFDQNFYSSRQTS